MGMQRLRGQEEAADGTGLIPLRSWPRDPQGLETPDPRVTGWEEMGRGHDLPTGPSAGGRQRGGSCPQSPCLGGTARGQQTPHQQSGDQVGPAQGSPSGL